MPMIAEPLPDIPRIYTAVAEWVACSLYVLLLWNTRIARRRTVAALITGLPLLIGVQVLAGMAPMGLWIPGMLTAVSAMGLVIWAGTDEPLTVVGHLTARAFIAAELVASLSWQLTVWFIDYPRLLQAPVIGVGAAVHVLAFGIIWTLEKRHFPRGENLHLGAKDLWSTLTVTAITFAMSNLSFFTVLTPFSARAGTEVFYIRTLVDLCGFVTLYAQQERLREVATASELATMEAMLHSQHSQYRQAKADIEALARARHDLKHQIAVIRDEVDPERAREHLAQLERQVGAIQQQYHCGHPVVDVILTSKAAACASSDITFTAVADGTLVEGIATMDLATLFGNALDNAIEASLRVPDPDKRLVKLALHAKGSMVVLRVENWFDGRVELDEHGDLRTVKADRESHGIGVRSIRWTAKKYGGEVATSANGNWFALTVLLPSTSLESPARGSAE